MEHESEKVKYPVSLDADCCALRRSRVIPISRCLSRNGSSKIDIKVLICSSPHQQKNVVSSRTFVSSHLISLIFHPKRTKTRI